LRALSSSVIAISRFRSTVLPSRIGSMKLIYFDD
jgi:hypothetical protein